MRFVERNGNQSITMTQSILFCFVLFGCQLTEKLTGESGPTMGPLKKNKKNLFPFKLKAQYG